MPSCSMRRDASWPIPRCYAWPGIVTASCMTTLDYHGDTALAHAAASDGGAVGAFLPLDLHGHGRSACARVHRAMGVPEDVTRETCSAVAAMVARYRREPGNPLGVHLNTAYWLRHHTAGRLFRHGRMEYMIRPSWGTRAGLPPSRKRRGDRPGRRRRALQRERLCGWRGWRDDPEHGWTATLTTDGAAVVGYPISPYGMAIRQQVRLEQALWERQVRKGDAVLEMHIPEGGGMSLDRCADSMRRAVPFFRRYFPAKPFRAIVCSSWILNNLVAGHSSILG